MALAARATARVSCPIPTSRSPPASSSDAVERCRRSGNGWAEAIAVVALGRVAWLRGRRDEALAHFERRDSRSAEAGGDLFTQTVAGHHLARLRLLGGEVGCARDGGFRGRSRSR